MIQYILECIAFQLIFLLIYDLFLKKETFFQWNRIYLMGTYVASMALPWIKIEAFSSRLPESYTGYPEFLWNIDQTGISPLMKDEQAFFSISMEYAVLFIGMGIASILFGYKLFRIYKLRAEGDLRYFKHFTQVIVKQSTVAFSFFKTIFLGDQVVAKEHKSIIAHELVHIQQKHSLDLLFFELMRILCWFNPLVYSYQSKISELHEFIADSKVAKTSRKEHYQLLLSQVFDTQKISFVNQFSKKSLIKKRIVMLQRARSRRVLGLKYLVLIPFVLGMLFYTSCEQQAVPSDMGDTEISSGSDQALIDQITAKINEEEEGSFFKYYMESDAFKRYNSENTIVSKEEFFEIRIRLKWFVERLNRENFSDGMASENPNQISKLSNPSTVLYQSYVQRMKAFQLLDKNLKLSIKAHKQSVTLVALSNNYPDDYYVYEVGDITDLTGDEVRAFNAKMDEVFEQESTAFSSILITDDTNAVRVYAMEKLPSSVAFGSANSSNVTSTTERYNKLVKERERLLQSANENNPIIKNLDKQLKELKAAGVSNRGVSVPFAVIDEVPVFPGCENAADPRVCFNQKIQEHIRKNFNYPLAAQQGGIQGRVSIMFTIGSDGNIRNIRKRGPHELLEQEAERIIKRLPKMTSGKQNGTAVDVPFSIPITFRIQ